VGKVIKAKIYSNRISFFYDGERIAEHHRKTGVHKWGLELDHYLKTLKKKPGALTGSMTLQQADQKIKNIYDTYYTKNPKEFIELIQYIQEGASITGIEK